MASAEQVTEEFVPSIEPGSVGAQKPFHAVHQVGLGSFDDQVKVIAHETIRMNLPIGFFARLLQRFEEEFSVVIIVENVLPVIPSVHDMIDCSFVLNSKLPGHARQCGPTARELSILRTDPCSDEFPDLP